MDDFDSPAEIAKREQCRQEGHVPGRTEAGEPVVTSDVIYCIRCGKFERSVWPKEKNDA